jgi:alpha-ketoglutarate-dependent taurine dioxygenase
VMESTRTPPEVYIFLHQEMAYLPFNPRLVAFYCKQPADEGGRTVIADMRGLLEALPPGMQKRLVDQGVIYGRNMRNEKLENDWRADPVYRHHTWQQWFGTDDTASVSAQLEERGISYEWDADRNLRFWTHRPGVTNHPETGQLLFFNQIYAQTPHRLCVGEEYPALMDAAYGDTVPRPYFVSVGDGKQLTEEEFFIIHNELERRRVDFDWQAGDVLLLENKFTGHGRTAFRGPREVQVMLFE